jgi:hypothetical protein
MVDIKIIVLINAADYDLSFAGIGFQNGGNDYLLAVFETDDVLLKRNYKSLNNAKRGFARIFTKRSATPTAEGPGSAITGSHVKKDCFLSNNFVSINKKEQEIEPEWTDFAYTFSYLERKKPENKKSINV